MERRVVVIYRISDQGYQKVKPDYINNRTCLINAYKHLKDRYTSWIIIGDNLSETTLEMIRDVIPYSKIMEVNVGHGAGTFNIALTEALKEKDDNTIVYFVENDYLHRENSLTVLREGIELGASFVTLYDHPDKYLKPEEGGNPLCTSGGEPTVVYRSPNSWFKLTNSTTMTFASTVKTLRETEPLLRKYTQNQYPEDFKMFLELRTHSKTVISSIPGYSTHGESRWLSPGIDWEKEAKAV